MRTRQLRRLIGWPTALLLGMGVAIGSGILRTPGEVARFVQSPSLILLLWVGGGLVVCMQGLVTAELATRFPFAGGEYGFLKHAYGDFVAFFFGWAYTIFIVGGGAATIAIALGEFGGQLWGLTSRQGSLLGAGAVVLITLVNATGLQSGAWTQNVLTALKILALVGISVVGFTYGGAPAAAEPPVSLKLGGAITAMLAILWAYDGTTDAVKLAEEIKDVRRALPRAVLGSTLALIVLYCAVNWALLRLVPAPALAGHPSAPGEALAVPFGSAGRNIILVVGVVICLGSLSSTILATIRVAFAQARDGLTFRFIGHMSRAQAPVPALVAVAAFACVLVLNRDFEKALGIYFLAGCILFGLSYASLIVFRLRGPSGQEDHFRCPAGIVLAGALVVLQASLAAGIVVQDIRRGGRDWLYTLGMMAAICLFYLVWKRLVRR